MAASELRLPADDPALPPATGAAGEGLVPGLLGEGDIDSGLALSDGAGWNQTGDDWRIFIRHGRTIGLRDGKGRWVATAAALPYGNDHGYVSMVLVADDWRHRGLASRLMDDCVAHLRASGIVPLLDATPAGAAVYAKIGFVAGFAFERWEGEGAALAVAPSGTVLAAGPAQAETLIDLDRSAGGIDRSALLGEFLARQSTRAWLGAGGDGFALRRGGRRAVQVGPVVAVDDDEALALLAAALAGVAGRVFIDVPAQRTAFAAELVRRGFTRQRAFVRMALGDARAAAARERVFALAGPEFG